jgi:rhamnogalacturonyl hydrolase YesR
MKTTVELSDALLEEARELAQRRRWTMRMVLEESLRSYLRETSRSQKQRKLRHTVFGNPNRSSQQPPWPETRNMIYGLPGEES